MTRPAKNVIAFPGTSRKKRVDRKQPAGQSASSAHADLNAIVSKGVESPSLYSVCDSPGSQYNGEFLIVDANWNIRWRLMPVEGESIRWTADGSYYVERQVEFGPRPAE